MTALATVAGMLAAGPRQRRRIANAAIACDCRDRRGFDFDGSVIDHHTRGAFLRRRQTEFICAK
jgi:hypothetical protein